MRLSDQFGKSVHGMLSWTQCACVNTRRSTAQRLLLATVVWW